ncbi:MAG: nucleoside 2-deoxyribosyltransferase [Balneola sp.]|nr:MAG: nucleoside 2-deoxyribosyltransferase [Balneola sp.]
MINVIGGVYYENCRYPYWDEIYGSGLRAAIAISELSDEVVLTSPIKNELISKISGIADSFGIKLNPIYSEILVEFFYLHGLSAPTIFPDLGIIEKETIHIEGERILQYGILENDVIVDGEKVVYDPQSPLSPKHFDENGSKAQELAIVLNESEAKFLSGESDIVIAGNKLLERSQVVVIKQGAFGAKVFETGKDIVSVPAFKTDRIFSIGSGDIFSAVFAYYWIEQSSSSSEAALFASRASAYYCNSKLLPLDEKYLIDQFSFEELHPIQRDDSYEYDIYLAGPFFSIQEFWFVNDVRLCLLNMGLKVFSPIHEIGFGAAEYVAKEDLRALKKSKAIFALCDGMDPGTIFEIGYGKANNLPVFLYCSHELDHNTTMFEGTGCEIHEDLTTALYKVAWKIFEG